jgi:hypothetical protein
MPVRHGQLAEPATQVSVTHTALLHVSPVPQASPGPQAQPSSPAGQLSQRLPAQRRPALQVELPRQVHAASPRRQSTQVPATHSPVVQAPATHWQPMSPSQPASSSG